jgi:hypothetical protein
MRALGPGSVSSFLKIILDVTLIVLWIVIGGVVLVAAIGLVVSFNPDLLGSISIGVDGAGGALDQLIHKRSSIVSGFLAAGVYLAGVLIIVATLRRISMTLTVGDPFHPDNIARLRLIGLMLAALELGRYAIWAISLWLLPNVQKVRPDMSVTAWFSVLVVFVLAEVFREGARLRREAELTI